MNVPFPPEAHIEDVEIKTEDDDPKLGETIICKFASQER